MAVANKPRLPITGRSMSPRRRRWWVRSAMLVESALERKKFYSPIGRSQRVGASSRRDVAARAPTLWIGGRSQRTTSRRSRRGGPRDPQVLGARAVGGGGPVVQQRAAGGGQQGQRRLLLRGVIEVLD